MTQAPRAVAGPQIWTGSTWLEDRSWEYTLNDWASSCFSEMVHLYGLNPDPSLDVPQELVNGVLPTVVKALDDAETGRGFALIKHVPVENGTSWAVGRVLVKVLAACGTIVSRLGHDIVNVRDEGYGLTRPKLSVAGHQTRTGLDFHTDGTHIVALLCLSPAARGGENKLVSSGAIYNEIVATRPDLAPLLFEPFYWDLRDTEPPGAPKWFASPLCSWRDGKLAFQHTPKFILSAQRHPDVPRLSPAQLELLELISAIAERPGMAIEMTFASGDLQIIGNYNILHARNQYEDPQDGRLGRHLLRVWLELPNGRLLEESFREI